LWQVEKAEHGVIAEEEHYYGGALSEYAADFVSMLMAEGTSTAARMLPGMQDFQQGEPPAGTLRPQVWEELFPLACAGACKINL
jgi:hypothetical protein